MNTTPQALQRLSSAKPAPNFGQGWNPAELEFDTEPAMPRDKSRPIALVGAGFVMHLGHMPAYRNAGLNVQGVFDVSQDRAKEAADLFGIPRVFRDIDEICNDKSIEVVSVAVPSAENVAVVGSLLEAGKHVLMEKPLGLTLDDARAILEISNRYKGKLAVNQNGRWDPSNRFAKRLMEHGLIGRPVIASVEMRFHMRWSPYLRDEKYPHLIMLNQSIHHLDNFRFWFGDPESVICETGRIPGQAEPGENLAAVVLRYKDGPMVTLISNGFSWADDSTDNFRIEGLQGIVKGTIGWQGRTPSTASFISRQYPEFWYQKVPRKGWYPDSFAGAMCDLLAAIEDDREPETAAADNLKTMQLVFAAYKAADEHKAIAPADM